MVKVPHKRPSLLAAESGNVVILVALGIFLMVMACGVAVDMARAQTLQNRMSNALDAAGLAAGATANSLPLGYTVSDSCTQQNLNANGCWVLEQVQRYFAANFQTGYIDSGNVDGTGTVTVASPTVTAVLVRNGTAIDLQATTNQATRFMKIFGKPSLQVAAVSEVVLRRTDVGLEVVLALDNTGSMNTVLPSAIPADNISKIVALKGAVPLLLNQIYGSGNDQVLGGSSGNTPLVWVGMVPYTDMVNVANPSGGTSTMDNGVTTYTSSYLPGSYFSPSADAVPATTPFPGNSSSGKSVWTGCIDARTPATGVTSNFYGNDNCISGVGSACTSNLSSDLSLSTATTFTPLDTSGWDNNATIDIACPKPVVPMSSSKSAIITAVCGTDPTCADPTQGLYATGNTLINIGLAWSWRMIERWSGLSSVASSYDSDTGITTRKKVIILMTDGANTDPGVQCTAWTGCTSPQSPTWPNACCTQAPYPETCYDQTCSIDPGETCSTECGNTNYVCTNYSDNICTAGYYNSYYSCCWGNGCPTDDIVNSNPHDCGYTQCTDAQTQDQCTYYVANNPNAYEDFHAAGTNTLVPGTWYAPNIDTVGDNNGEGITGFSYMDNYNNPTASNNEWQNECDAVKAQGIIIYTIGFGTADGGPTVTGNPNSVYDPNCNDITCATYVNGPLLKYCASPGDYYLANTPTALRNIFITIANQLNNLRVSQ